MSVLIYGCKVAVIQLLAYGFYKGWLEDEVPGQWKRLYLLGVLCFSFLLPSLVIRTVSVVGPISENIDFTTRLATLIAQKTNSDSENSVLASSSIIPVQYLLGLLWLIVFVYRLIPLGQFLEKHRQKLRIARLQPGTGFRLAVLPYPIEPHTFGRTVFIHDDPYPERAILLHEAAHARQWHSFDRVAITLLRQICWFFPHLKWYENALVLVHESLADRDVLQQGIPLTSYQSLLLNALGGAVSSRSPASGFNFSFTKKRFLLMKKISPNRSKLIAKLLAAGCLLVLLLVLTGKTVYTQSTGADYPEPPFGFSPPPTAQNITDWQDRSTYAVWLDNRLLTPEEVAQINPDEVAYFMPTPVDPNGKNYADHKVQVVIQTKQNLMEEQHLRGVRKQNEYYNDPMTMELFDSLGISTVNFRIPGAKPISPKHPTAEQLTAWLSESRYGIWLDGKRVENSALLRYATEDIFYYVESRLARNAANFGKHDYQVDLLTEKAFLDFQRSMPASPPK